jgi:hypothetical protein
MKSTDAQKRQAKVEAAAHIGIFIIFFCSTAVFLKNSYAASNVTLFDSIFGRERTWMELINYWLKRVIYIGSLNDVAMLLLRAIFSSFAKDGIISIYFPKTYKNKVPSKLTDKVMGKTFNPTWIPKSDRDVHIELKLGKPVPQNMFYPQVKPIFDLICFLSSKLNFLLITFTELVNQVMNFIVTTSLGMVSFSLRSVITAMSLVLLVPIHIGQTVLRIIRWVHNLIAGCLKGCSQAVNDIGMLNVDLIKESYVYEAGDTIGEEIQKQQTFVRKSMMNLMMPDNGSSFGSSLKPSEGASMVSGDRGIDRARSYVPSSDAPSE